MILSERLLKRKQKVEQRFAVISNDTRQTILADHADIADTGATRRRGLLGRKSLDPGEGLWIVPCQGVHCWGMQFPIDVVYLDKRKRVRKLRRALKPWRLSICLTAHSVLELPGGTIDATRTERGDQLRLTLH